MRLKAIIVFTLLALMCTTPTDPNKDPNNAFVDVLVRLSNSTIVSGAFTDTIGNTISIGIITKLPDLIDSVKIKVRITANSDTTFTFFHDELQKDTTKWFPVSLFSIGDKAITMTIYKTGVPSVEKTVFFSVIAKSIQITAQPMSSSILKGDTLTLTIGVSGTGPFTYQWFHSGSVVQSATNPSFITSNATDTDKGIYFCVVKNSFGDSVKSVEVNVNVRTIPTQATVPIITSQSSTVSVTAGSSADLQVVVSGSTPLHYAWSRGSSKLTVDSCVLHIGSVAATDTGSYSCIATNSAGSDTSTVMLLAIVNQVLPPSIKTDPTDLIVTQGEKATFSVTAEGSNLTYQWTFNGTPITSGTSTSFAIALASMSDSGLYAVKVTNSASSVTSKNAHLVVLPSAFNVTIVQGTHGAISPSGSNGIVPVKQGDSLRLSIKADLGYKIKDVLVDNVENAAAKTNGIYTFKNIGANHTITAHFEQSMYSLNVSATNGTIQKTPNDTLFAAGTSVALKAVPLAGYSFIGWSGDLSGAKNPDTVVMNSAKQVSANFATQVCTLTIVSVKGAVTKSPSKQFYSFGDLVQLTANPDSFYHFVNWTGDTASNSAVFVVKMNGSKKVTANFVVDAPTNLHYRDTAFTFLTHQSITPIIPSWNGVPVDSFSIAPKLEDSLQFDKATGQISGKIMGSSATIGQQLCTVYSYNRSGKDSCRVSLNWTPLMLLKPIAGQAYHIGDSLEIRWSGDWLNLSSTSLAFKISITNGKCWLAIGEIFNENSVKSGVYKWKITTDFPDEPPGCTQHTLNQCMMQIYSPGQYWITDETNCFSIVP